MTSLKEQHEGVARIPDGDAERCERAEDRQIALPCLGVSEEHQNAEPRVGDEPRKTACKSEAAHRVGFGEDDARSAVGHQPHEDGDEGLKPIARALQKADDALLPHEEKEGAEGEVDDKDGRRHLQRVQKGREKIQRPCPFVPVFADVEFFVFVIVSVSMTVVVVMIVLVFMGRRGQRRRNRPSAEEKVCKIARRGSEHEFDDEDDRDTRRDDRRDVEQDFDFGLPDEDEEDDESIGSIFDEAGEDEDFVSDDLFGAEEDEDDLSDVDDDFSFGDLFGDEENEDESKASDASDDASASDLFGDEDDE